MNIAAISSVTSTYVSQAVPRLQNVGAPQTANAAPTPKTPAAQAVNFGPATVISLSPQAQSLAASQSNALNSQANSAATTQAQQTNQAALAFSYKTTAEQVWVQVLSAMGLTEQDLAAMSLSERNATEAKAEVMAEARMTAQVQQPSGVSSNTEATAISSAVQAVIAA